MCFVETNPCKQVCTCIRWLCLVMETFLYRFFSWEHFLCLVMGTCFVLEGGFFACHVNMFCVWLQEHGGGVRLIMATCFVSSRGNMFCLVMGTCFHICCWNTFLHLVMKICWCVWFMGTCFCIDLMSLYYLDHGFLFIREGKDKWRTWFCITCCFFCPIQLKIMLERHATI